MNKKIIESDLQNRNSLQIATFAAGCFWGVEEAFRQVKGVKSTMVGYTGGGWFENPTYKDVCTHNTGHAEAVQIQFDPNEVSYEQLLDIFWSIHDPTTKNRQGPDIGSQYRSMLHIIAQNKNYLLKNQGWIWRGLSYLREARLLQKLFLHLLFTKPKIIIRNIIKREEVEAVITIQSKELEIRSA